MWQVDRGNPGPVILDDDMNAGSYCLRAHRQPVFRLPILQRIPDEILQRASQRRAIGNDWWKIERYPLLQRDSVLANLHLKHFESTIDQVGNIGRFESVRLAGVNSGEVENLLDHLRQPAAFVANESSIL